MCSIGGFICSKPLQAHTSRRLAAALLFFGVNRGRQSSGIFVNNRLFKKAQDAEQFVFEDAFSALFDGPVQKCLVHNRQPTSGGLGDEQAHPFWVGETITAHNGWLSNYKELAEKFELKKPSGVDSELLAAAMEKLGPAGMSEFMKHVSGTASLAAIHKDELYLGRDGNPLEYYALDVIVEDGSAANLLIFGSTEPQVVRAINYVWLIPNMKRTITLPEDKLFHVSAQGVLKDVSKFETKSYYNPNTRENWRSRHPHGHDFSEYGCGQTLPLGNGQGTIHLPERSSIGTTYGVGTGSWRPHIEVLNKEGRMYIKVGSEEFSLSEMLAIKSDPTILDKPADRGWGFRPSAHGMYPAHSWRYEIMQRVKFGDLKDIIENIVRGKVGGAENQNKKKKKKDRDRNTAASDNQTPQQSDTRSVGTEGITG